MLRQSRRKMRHRNQWSLLNHLPKRLRQMSRRKTPNLMDKNHQKRLTRKPALNQMNCRRKSKKKRQSLRKWKERTKKTSRKKRKRRTLWSTTWALSLPSTRPNLTGTMWNPCSRATASRPRLAALWPSLAQMLRPRRLELSPKETPFSRMRTSWKCGKLTLLCNRKKDSKKSTSRAPGASSKTKTTASICMIPTGSCKSWCRKARVSQLILIKQALVPRNNQWLKHSLLQTSRSKSTQQLMIQYPCLIKTQI